MRVVALVGIVIGVTACGGGASPAPESAARAVPSSGAADAPSVEGWEGFFPPQEVDAAWLDERGIAIDADAIARNAPRVVRLILASGEVEVPSARIEELQALHCEDDARFAWNERLCESLEAARCQRDTCRYDHFGSCSGLAIGRGWVVTAAHCVASLGERAADSQILWPDDAGRPARASAFGELRLGKEDFAHHWVAVEGEDPVDVAAIRTDDRGIERIEASPLPPEGTPVFVFGYPRVERRPAAARARAGYGLVGGTPAVSFGRLADRNEQDRPLCNVDGRQDHWALASPCPTGPVAVDGEDTWRGPILGSPFLATYDTANGYSGGPVFDAAGRWIGVNATLISDVDPQDRFSSSARMVATPAQRAVSRLGLVE